MESRTIHKPQITEDKIELINRLITTNPNWGRTKLSRELCRIWNWCGYDGHPKDMACRVLLRELDAKGKIKLPAAQFYARHAGSRDRIKLQQHQATPIESGLKALLPLKVTLCHGGPKLAEFKSLLQQYHYLGFGPAVFGENIKYMIYNRQDQLLACLLFGASAYTCKPRDKFIGWEDPARKVNLINTTNNTRFLILPWVKVPHLASHILGLICRRIARDWQEKYGHRVYLLETFVEQDRFKGTCYKAANWIRVGETTGRSRNDRYRTLAVPIKDIYLYPLFPGFREVLR